MSKSTPATVSPELTNFLAVPKAQENKQLLYLTQKTLPYSKNFGFFSLSKVSFLSNDNEFGAPNDRLY